MATMPTFNAHYRGTISTVSLPVKYLYSSASTFKNAVASKYAVQGKCSYEKLSSLFGSKMVTEHLCFV